MNKDYKLLSILLQKIEARIFVETIYPELQQRGYNVYTKHDSILCSENLKPEVMGIMNEILLREKVIGRLK